jgi:hypothetical protein
LETLPANVDAALTTFAARGRCVRLVTLLDITPEANSSWVEADADSLQWRGDRGVLTVRLPVDDRSQCQWFPTTP